MSAINRQRLALEVRRAGKPFIAVIALAIAAVISTAIILANIGVRLPWAGAYMTRVAVDDVSGVVAKKHDVRLAGLEVGRIEKVSLERGRAILTISMDPEHAPLYRDARLRLRPETPLEDIFLNVESRGTRGAGRLGERDVLSTERTRTPVDIGRVLNVFNADTRVRVEQGIDELGRGLDDGGRDLRRALVELAPFLEAARRISKVTAVRRQRTRRLVHNFRLMTEELARRETDLRRLVSGGAASLTELARNDDALEETISGLPPTMRRVRSSFATLRQAADELDPAFVALGSSARALPKGLAGLERFTNEADPTFAALRRPLPALEGLVGALVPTAAGLRQSFDRLRPVPPRLDTITARIGPCERPLAKFFHNTISLTKFSDNRATLVRGQTIFAGGGSDKANQTATPSCTPGGPRGPGDFPK
jgi:phospholipid/cholesterol/gamma-HCH transport system substrate-binding protein